MTTRWDWLAALQPRDKVLIYKGGYGVGPMTAIIEGFTKTQILAKTPGGRLYRFRRKDGHEVGGGRARDWIRPYDEAVLAIRQMDGPALTHLAWTLGLAPNGVAWPDGCAYAYDENEHAWRPWSRLGQADAVFRQLRARGWTTSCSWYMQMGHGMVSVRNMTKHFEQLYGRPEDEPECIALLRCAVLAAASEKETS